MRRLVLVRFLTLLAVGAQVSVSSFAESPMDDPQALFREAIAASNKGESPAAIKLLDRVLAKDDKNVQAYYYRGRERFRTGDVDGSIADFDMTAKLAPERERELWERGLSHYYASRFDDGAKQFEQYQTFYDNDVENSVWRYACVARKHGAKKALETLMPIENDRRVPFMEIYAMFQGKKKPAEVLAAANAGEATDEDRKERLFYSHLYIGLWYEANGNAEKSKEHMTLADEKYKIGHYMWDVAHVHMARLNKAGKAEKKD
jgi:lipoprotein NlpI